MGGFGLIPPPTDNIPVPKDDPVEFRPAPQEQLPVSAGFTGPGGQAANLATQFMTGWMTGKYMKEQRMQRESANKVGNAKSAVDLAASSVSNLLKQGKDESDPDVQNARRALAGAWSGYVSTASEYATPAPQLDANGKPVKQSFGSKVKGAVSGAFGPHHPEMMTAAVLQGMQKMDPQTLVAGITPEQKAQMAEAKNREGVTQQQTTIRDLQNQLMTAQGVLAKAPDEGSKKAASADVDRIQAQLAAQGVKPVEAAPQGTTSLQAQQVSAQQSSLERYKTSLAKMQTGGWAAMSPLDKATLFPNMKPDPEMDLFMQDVKSPEKPNATYDTPLLAMEAYKKMNVKYTPRAYASPYEQIRENIAPQVQHMLTYDENDPVDQRTAVLAAVRKYGLARPLRPGEDPPDWLVGKLADAEYSSEKNSGKVVKVDPNLVKQTRAMALEDYAAQNPDDARFINSLKAGVPPQSTTWEKLPFTASTAENYTGFKERFNQYLRNSKYADDALSQAFPGLYQGQGGTESTSPTGTFTMAQGGNPPPSGSTGRQATAPGVTTYTVTINGKTKDVPFTEDGLAKAKVANPNATFTAKGTAQANPAAEPGQSLNPPPADEAPTTPAAKPAAKTTPAASGDDIQLPPALNEVTRGIRDLNNIDPEAAKRAKASIADMMKKGTVTVGAGRMAIDRKMTSDEMLEKARAIVKNEAAGVQSRLQDQTDRAEAKAKADREDAMRNAIIKAMTK